MCRQFVFLVTFSLSLFPLWASAQRPVPRERIEGYLTEGNLFVRQKLVCTTGKCYVMIEKDKPGFNGAQQSVVRAILDGDPEDREDDAILVRDLPGHEKEKWGTDWAGSTGFICHTYTFGDAIGLTRRDRLAGYKRYLEAFGGNPVQVVLDSYYERLSRDPVSEDAFKQVEKDKSLQEGDALFFTQATEDGVHYVHSGKLVWWKERWWLASKVGDGPLVATTLKSVYGLYAREYPIDSIEIFRLVEDE